MLIKYSIILLSLNFFVKIQGNNVMRHEKGQIACNNCRDQIEKKSELITQENTFNLVLFNYEDVKKGARLTNKFTIYFGNLRREVFIKKKTFSLFKSYFFLCFTKLKGKYLNKIAVFKRRNEFVLTKEEQMIKPSVLLVNSNLFQTESANNCKMKIKEYYEKIGIKIIIFLKKCINYFFFYFFYFKFSLFFVFISSRN